MKNRKKTLVSALIFILIIAVIAIMLIDLLPLLSRIIANAGDEGAMMEAINDYGARGVPILIGLQAIQVIVAFLPAVVVQVLAGLCYGIFFGTLICVVGYMIGNMLVFFALRQFSSTFEQFFKPKEKKNKKSFINIDRIKEMSHPEYVAVFLYFIPGIPNGILPYIFAQTKIDAKKYVLSILGGCIPSILICNIIGQFLARKQYIAAGVLSLITAAMVVLLFIFKDKIISIIEEKTEKREKKKKQ